MPSTATRFDRRTTSAMPSSSSMSRAIWCAPMIALLLTSMVAAAPPQPAVPPVKSIYELDGQRFLATARHDLETLKMFTEGLHRTAKVAVDNKAVFGTVNKS